MRITSRRGAAEEAALESERCNRSCLELLKDCGFTPKMLAAIQHTGTWWVMSAKDDTTDKKVAGYKQYGSDYLVTRMIGCSGSDFERAIFEDKGIRVSKVNYLKKSFDVEAQLLRNEVIIFSFNKNMVYDRVSVNHQLLETEPFSLDGMEGLIENIRTNCTKKLAHEFMYRLKALDEEERARAALKRLFGTSDSAKLERLAVFEHDGVTHTEQCDSLPPVVDSELGLKDLKDSCEESALCGDTRFDSQSCSASAAIVSPPLPPQDKDVTITALELLCPRKGRATISHLMNDPKSDLTEWSEDKDTSRSPYEEARTLKGLLHALSGQNIRRAAKMIDLVLKKDSNLASAVEITREVDTDRDINDTIVNSQVDFLTAMNYNSGTRHALDQQAVDVVHAASLWSAKEEDHKKIKSRMNLSGRVLDRMKPQIHKLHSKLESQSQSADEDGKKNKQVWEPIERKLRED